MRLTDLVEACAVHRPAVIVLAPDDFSNVLAFCERNLATSDWRISERGAITYRGAPIVLSTEWQRSYIVEDRHDGPVFHVIG